MLLADYLSSKPLTNKQFSEQLEPHLDGGKVSPRTVESWRQGRVLPHGLHIKAISEATDNLVTYEDLVRALRPKA